MPDKPLFLLVHSPLVGPQTWSSVAEELTARGRRALVPSLRTDPSNKEPFWSRQVAAAVSDIDPSSNVLVVGHSGAGALLPAIGQRLGNQVAGYIFVDAGLPAGGRSWADTAPPQLVERLRDVIGGEFVPPWHEWFGGEDALSGLLPDADQRHAFVAELGPLPWAMLQEARPSYPDWPRAPVGYLLMSEGYEADAAEAGVHGWQSRRIDGNHLSTMTEPDRVTDELLALENEMFGRAR